MIDVLVAFMFGVFLGGFAMIVILAALIIGDD
jgi:hypothetical protein